MYDWKRVWRLATFIDCGTIKWFRKLYLGFQLSDFKITPKDVTLPEYCIYAKSPYWWLINDVVNKENESILSALWYVDWDIIDFLYDNVGKLVKLNIVDNEYQWKTYPMLLMEWHEPYTEELDIERGTELKKFKITDDMTKESVSALWFENKHLKQSDEYKKLTQLQDVEQTEVDNLF